MSFAGALLSSAAFDWRRLLRGRGWMIAALAAPVAAHFMLPSADASYAVMAINGAQPVLDPAVLGLELGVLSAVLLTPLAYVFLRAGPTRIQPVQLFSVSPHARGAEALGRWAAETGLLWLLLAFLSAAGVTLGLLRFGQADALQTLVALWAPAAPALALTAAVRRLLDARMGLRGWVGDVVFFVFWIFALSSGGLAAMAQARSAAAGLLDPFGYVTPVVLASNEPVQTLSIGASPASDGARVEIAAWRGVADPLYLAGRIGWLAVAAFLAWVSGAVLAPRWAQTKPGKQRKSGGAPRPLPATRNGAPLRRAVAPTLSLTRTFIAQLLRDRMWTVVLLLAAALGAAQPHGMGAGPLSALALIFVATDVYGRWQPVSLRGLLRLTPHASAAPVAFLAGCWAVAALAQLPALLAVALGAQTALSTGWVVFLCGAPVAVALLTAISRSSTAARLLMLMAWYGLLSVG